MFLFYNYCLNLMESYFLFLIFYFILFCFIVSYVFFEHVFLFISSVRKHKKSIYLIFIYILFYTILWYNKNMFFFSMVYFYYFFIFVFFNFISNLFIICYLKKILIKLNDLKKNKQNISFFFFIFFILISIWFMIFIFIFIKYFIIFVIKFSILERLKFLYVVIKHFIFIDILNNPFYYFISYIFCCYTFNLYAYQVDVPFIENVYMGKDYGKCLDGVEKVDYHELLGQKKSDEEKTEEALANFMAKTANDPIDARHSTKHIQEFEEFRKIPVFEKIAPETHKEFVSSVVPAIKEAFTDSERTGEVRGHVLFLSADIANGPDGITPDGKAVQYKTIDSLHISTVYECAIKYKKAIDENDMHIHIYFKKFYDQKAFELFKIEHPEFFKNILLHDLTKEKPFTQEQTLKIIQHAAKNKNYFLYRERMLSCNSWFSKLMHAGRKNL